MDRRVYIWEVGMHAAFEAHAQFCLGRRGRESACALTEARTLVRVGSTAGTRDGVLSTIGWGSKAGGGTRGGDEGNRVGALGERSCSASEKQKKRVWGGEGGSGGEIPAPVGDRALRFRWFENSFSSFVFNFFFLMFLYNAFSGLARPKAIRSQVQSVKTKHDRRQTRGEG